MKVGLAKEVLSSQSTLWSTDQAIQKSTKIWGDSQAQGTQVWLVYYYKWLINGMIWGYAMT